MVGFMVPPEPPFAPMWMAQNWRIAQCEFPDDPPSDFKAVLLGSRGL